MTDLAKIDAELRDAGRVARDLLDLASVALRNPQNEPISDEVMATINAADDVIARVEMSQWDVAKASDKRRAHASVATCLALLHQTTGWMKTKGAAIHAPHLA